jgi:hypothetical protein
MTSRYEAGSYTNRGFSAIDPQGFCQRLCDWLGRSYANHGAGWILIDDQSTIISDVYTIPAPGPSNITCHSVGHGLKTGQQVYLTTSSAAPTGLAVNTEYWIYRIGADDFGLCTTFANSLLGTAIYVTGAGTGTQTVISCPYKVYCNIAAPIVNQVANFLKIGYCNTAEGVNINSWHILECLWWDVTNHIPIGTWAQYSPNCDKTTFNNYWFNGNTSFINVALKFSTNTYFVFHWSIWAGVSPLVESAALTGTLQADITAGSYVVIQLGTGEASNFTIGNWYFIYDFDGHSWVDYVHITDRNTGTDTITVASVGYNFPTGAILGAYPHRFCTCCNATGGGAVGYNGSSSLATIPYISSVVGEPKVFYPQSGVINCHVHLKVYDQIIIGGAPEDEIRYYAQLPIIVEYKRSDDVVTANPRVYGVLPAGSMYFSSTNDLTLASSIRAINGAPYKYFVLSNSIGNNQVFAVLIPVADLS